MMYIAFISTNWDTVIEDLLQDTHDIESFDYGCGALHGSLHPATGTYAHRCGPRIAETKPKTE
jgi:hypothetical protein